MPLRAICEEFGFNINAVNGKVNVVSSNTSSNVYNQQVTDATLTQSDYICDSNLLKPFVDGSEKMAKELLKQTGYGHSVYLEAATKQSEWAEMLSIQTVFTPEGKILKDTLVNEMKVVGKGYDNLYKGKDIDYDALLKAEEEVYKTIKSFRMALQKMGL